jgi:hypothetical protein
MLIDTRSLDAQEALDIGLITDIAQQEVWADRVEALQGRSETLPKFASQAMFDLTLPDTRDQDMATFVVTAGCPGLKARIQAYGAAVAVARKQRSG